MKKWGIYGLLIFVMLAWGMNTIMMKVLVANFMPLTMTAFRILLAAVTVFIILFALGKVRRLTKKEWKYVAAASLFNVVAHHYFLSLGFTGTSASSAGLVLGTGPLLTAIMAMIFLGARATWFKTIGIILGFTGVAFIMLKSSGDISGLSLGDVQVFLAIVAQAFSYILIKKAADTLDPRLMTGYMLLLGSAVLFVISLIAEPDGLSSMVGATADVWVVFVLSATVSTAIGHLIYNYAVGKVGAAESAIFMNFTPFFALVGSVLLLGETITLAQIGGFLFIIMGVLLGSGGLEDWLRQRHQQHIEAQIAKRHG
ncbi:DMT family transporter [Paenibacillus arenosi]|uniref:DMT family transporter n=1 Tax=Paenibacillus arenosi TaxID=2774142 RepID=A0ABR9AVA5_9BACL|nr:DMT family transporter [Paenibacillus arenosi]MBD8498054.1 DMT family transporter [Paenibacillus arenosi]